MVNLSTAERDIFLLLLRQSSLSRMGKKKKSKKRLAMFAKKLATRKRLPKSLTDLYNSIPKVPENRFTTPPLNQERISQNGEYNQDRAQKRSRESISRAYSSPQNGCHEVLIPENEIKRKWEANESYEILPDCYEHNMTEEEPYKRRCFSPIPQYNDYAAHQYSAEPAASWEQIRWTKTPNSERETGDLSTDSQIYKLGIIPYDYPNTLFKPHEYDKIQMAIFEKLETSPDPLPIINMGCINSLGVIPIACKGKISVDFIESFNDLIISGYIRLKVVDDKTLPKPMKMIWKSRNMACRYLPRVLNLIQRYNPGLDTSNWKIVDTLQGINWIRRIVYMDQTSSEYLKSKHYEIPDGIGKSVFSILYPRKKIRWKKIYDVPNIANYEIPDVIAGDDYKQNDNLCSPESNNDLLYPERIAPKTSHSWGEIVEDAIPPIDLTHEYSSEEDYEDFTGEL